MKKLAQKKKTFNKTPLKRLVSITLDRFRAASRTEQASVIGFLDWIIQTTTDPQLKNFHIDLKSTFAEVAK